MDEAALRLEIIRSDRETNERIVDLKTRRHMAVLAVGLTTCAAASTAAAFGQVPSFPAAGVAAASAGVVFTQVRAFGVLQRKLERGRREARASIARLIETEVETDVDEAAETEPGA